jgi:putative SOS response-associated peptidase YedK
MCGRYTIVKGDRIVQVIPNVTMPANLRMVGRYNVAPGQWVPAVTNDCSQLQLLRWGLIPSWARDESIGFKTINARSETLAQKPAFRQAFTRRRCLIPADGFYEWRAGPGRKAKTPMYIRLRQGDLFAFAGLWDRWISPDGTEIKSLTIITTPPNDLLKPIHNRMPAIIPPEGYADWLRPEEINVDDAQKWLAPFPAESMEAFAVRPLVNSVNNEGSDLIAPAPPDADPTAEKNAGRQHELFGDMD